MQAPMPSIRTSLRDPTAEVTYHVMAYRELSRQELLQTVALYLKQAKRKPKKGSTVTVITIIGYDR